MSEKIEKNEKYLNFLRELKLALGYTDKINLNDFISRHKVSRIAYKSLNEGGIISRVGEKKGSRYYWESPVEPNLKMAEELIRRIRINTAERNKEYTERKASEIKEIQERELASREMDRKTYVHPKAVLGEVKEETEAKDIKDGSSRVVSLFWGMFKFETHKK